MSGSAMCVGRKFSRNCGEPSPRGGRLCLLEWGAVAPAWLQKGKAVPDLPGEGRPCVLHDVVVSGEGGNCSRTCRVTVFC